ncbi:fibulin-1-like isoform X16 [Palaemon carinicauda]|uniref:fibulin-1-like isoform X16 n=1 Tax=Palaemon carinicauda TaxID=392227 RepID=UPI0035B61580
MWATCPLEELCIYRARAAEEIQSVMIPCNRMKTIISLLLLLAVVKLIHCQDHEQMIVLTLQGILQNLESINGQLKGHDELLQRIPDVQEKLEHLENNLQDMQEKLQHLENNLQGLSRETAQCLKGEDLEHLTNVSAAANQEIKSFHEEMSEVIAWSRKDKCSEGSLLCGKSRTCKNNPFSFTCSCPSGFTWDGSECEDVDECAEGKDDCVPNATCKNSMGAIAAPAKNISREMGEHPVSSSAEAQQK